MTGAVATGDDQPGLALSLGRRRLITVSLILAPLAQVFDTSMVSIALTQMQGSLSATQDQISWVLTSYLVAVTITTPFWGAIGGKFGRKPLLLVSLVGFMIFSMLAGASSSLNEVLIYRFAQGMFSAALIPLSLSSLLSVYPRDEISIAMSYWGVGVMFGPVFGPTIGGYIAEYYSWRWAFYLNLPVGILAFAMISVLVPRQHAGRKRRPFNYLGFVLLAIGVGTLQFVLDRGNRMDWFASSIIIVLTLVSAAAFWMFVVNSMASRTPFIDPAIFRDRNYLAGTVLRVLFGAVLFGSLVILPPFIQNQGGYSLIDSGMIMAPRGLGAMCGAMFVGRLIKVVDPRKVMGAAMLVIALTMYQFSTFTEDMDRTLLVIICFIQGLSFSSFVIPVNSVAFSTLKDEQRDVGTSFFSLLNNIGRNLGIGLLATFLARESQANRAILRDNITPFNDARRHTQLPDVWDMMEPTGLAALNRMVTKQAELIAYIADFRLLSVVVLICVPVLFLMNNPHRAMKATAA